MLMLFPRIRWFTKSRRVPLSVDEIDIVKGMRSIVRSITLCATGESGTEDGCPYLDIEAWFGIDGAVKARASEARGTYGGDLTAKGIRSEGRVRKRA